MIINTLKSANSVILSSIQANNNKQAVQTYLQQLTVLNTATSQLTQLLNLVSAMSERGIANNIISDETITSISLAVENCGEKVYDHSLDAGTVSSLKNAVATLRKEIDSSWNVISKNECSPIIEAISSLKGLLDDKKQADELLLYYDKVIQNTPVSANALDIYLENIKKGKKIIENLRFTSDTEVRVFIKKVGSLHATVKDLTPHIMEWLNDNNLSNKIRLRF